MPMFDIVLKMVKKKRKKKNYVMRVWVYIIGLVNRVFANGLGHWGLIPN